MTNHDEGTINLDNLPTAAQSNARIATDAPAAIAFVRHYGFADEGEILKALGVAG